jgi:hypothetical protein
MASTMPANRDTIQVMREDLSFEKSPNPAHQTEVACTC